MKVNNFDVLKEMGNRDGNISMAPLSNIIRVRKVKAGTQITIGVAGNDVVGRIARGELYGGFIMADKAEFDQVKKEMEEQLRKLA